MNKANLFKGALIAAGLMFTFGAILPWVISTVLLPLWMIIFVILGLAVVWAVILEAPYSKAVKYIRKLLANKDDNHDCNNKPQN
jgi:F0F1-type ATP synthase assembly protein I